MQLAVQYIQCISSWTVVGPRLTDRCVLWEVLGESHDNILPVYISAHSPALLKRFPSTKPNTFEQIEQYLDNARLHPTGRYWVDNVFLPTFLAHQFERAGRKRVTYKTTSSILSSLAKLSHPKPLETCVLPDDAKADLVCGAFVCRHRENARILSPVTSLASKLLSYSARELSMVWICLMSLSVR